MSTDTIRLREARIAAGLTQTELARRLHVGQSLISDLERGRRATLTVATLTALARALGCSPADLLAEPSPEKK